MAKHRGITLATLRDAEGLIEIIEDAESRTLYFGSRARQSSMLLRDPLALPLGYTRSMLAALLFCPQPARILLIGLGGGSQARFLLHHFPLCRLDCVEARASVVEVARRYFALPDEPRLRIQVDDGAAFIKRSPVRHYDLILVDAFDADGVHESVSSRAFYADCHAALNSGGVMAVNLWVTPKAPYKTLLADMQAGFAGQILQLPVERHANLVALGLTTAQTPADLRKLNTRAKQLGAQLDLDMLQFQRRLVHNNSGTLRRYLDLRYY